MKPETAPARQSSIRQGLVHPMIMADSDRGLSSLCAQVVDCKIASSRRERAAAFRLVYDSYLRGGLAEPNPYGVRITPFQLLPTTEVFVAAHRGRPVLTMSLVVDGELGLPMESIYADEVADRRQRGLMLAEVSCLAHCAGLDRGFLPAFLSLGRLMAQHARWRGVDELIVAVHPKHARFYRRFMAFEPFGSHRHYPSVRRRPAVALALNFERADRERPRSYDAIFGVWLDESQLQSQPISALDRAYFGRMAVSSGVEVHHAVLECA